MGQLLHSHLLHSTARVQLGQVPKMAAQLSHIPTFGPPSHLSFYIPTLTPKDTRTHPPSLKPTCTPPLSALYTLPLRPSPSTQSEPSGLWQITISFALISQPARAPPVAWRPWHGWQQVFCRTLHNAWHGCDVHTHVAIARLATGAGGRQNKEMPATHPWCPVASQPAGLPSPASCAPGIQSRR